MKNSMYKLWLLGAVLLLSGLFVQHLKAHSSTRSAVYSEKGKVFGGAYLQFASKMGGEISRDELRLHSELGVEGCARGSRIYQFSLAITRGGQTRIFQAGSNQLTKEMVSELNKLSVGDQFEFQKVKAYLSNSKDTVDVHGKKFVVTAS